MAGLMDLFGGGTADIYGDLISPEQRQALQQQAMMNTGLAILMGSTGQAGGPMPTLGQAVGGGYMAGQKGYQQGVENLLQAQALKAKMDEMRRAAQEEQLIAQTLTGGVPVTNVPPATMSPDASAAGEPAGMPNPSAVPAMPAAPAASSPEKEKAQRYRAVADAVAARDPQKAKIYRDIADQIDPRPEYGDVKTGIDPRTGKPAYFQVDKRTGASRPVEGFAPGADISQLVQDYEYTTGNSLQNASPAVMADFREWVRLNKPGTTVNVNGEQRTFTNEQDLRKEFTSLPVYKAFSEVQTAYDQIKSALSNPSPANDLAAATKFMKLLDPGSVVRESELAAAIQATGVEDRLRNYFNMMRTGKKLTPSQRKDFMESAQGLYNAAVSRYAPVAEQYRGLAGGYKLNPDNVVPKSAIPSAPAPVAPAPSNIKTYDPKTGKWS